MHLAFAADPGANAMQLTNPKHHTHQTFASGLLIPTFAKQAGRSLKRREIPARCCVPD
jgi:hypothetical protein